jgi:hypothetical protein
VFFVVKERIGCIPTACKGFCCVFFYQAMHTYGMRNEFAHLAPCTFYLAPFTPLRPLRYSLRSLRFKKSLNLTIFVYFSPINSFKERAKIIVSSYACDFPLRAWSIYRFGQTLTHVCVLMPIGASNIGHFANGVAVGFAQTLATTKVPDLYAKLSFQTINFFARSISLS